jgi:hypothetical protein
VVCILVVAFVFQGAVGACKQPLVFIVMRVSCDVGCVVVHCSLTVPVMVHIGCSLGALVELARHVG